MSRISVVVDKEAPLAVLKVLKQVSALGFSELRQRIEEAKPVFEPELFLNDHLEVAARLREILESAETHGAKLELFELEPNETWSTAPLDQCRITPEILRNILAEADDRFL